MREWLRTLGKADRETIGIDLLRLQTGWPVGLPLCRSLGRGLWELRSTLPSRREARLVFVVEDGELLVLHGFIKKTQRTPREELALAAGRLKEIRQ